MCCSHKVSTKTQHDKVSVSPVVRIQHKDLHLPAHHRLRLMDILPSGMLLITPERMEEGESDVNETQHMELQPVFSTLQSLVRKCHMTLPNSKGLGNVEIFGKTFSESLPSNLV